MIINKKNYVGIIKYNVYYPYRLVYLSYYS